MPKRHLFTSESVTDGHPDKIADGISDSVLDANMKDDNSCRVACEVMVTTGMVVVAGEITSKATVNFADVARDKIKRIGYNDPDMGFSHDTCAVLVSLDRQSSDISQGVSKGQGLYKEQGAGDQGMMFGYACDDTPELMPMPIMYSHRLTRKLASVRSSAKVPFFRPDGKSQVSVVYEDNKPVRVDTVVVSTQHSPDASHRAVRDAVIQEVIKPSIPAKWLTSKTKYLVNPTGRFVIGGPQGDCGLTGRKIIVDTYGGMGAHGGGAFSGKDPSKVDRSAAYMARHIAKTIVAAKLANRCEVQLAYAIGFPEPVSFLVETFGTGKVSEDKLVRACKKVFSMRPEGIIKDLDLLRPIYEKTSAFGHFGRSKDLKSFTWEKKDKVEALLAAV